MNYFFLHKLNMFQKCFLIITLTTALETKILLTSSFHSFAHRRFIPNIYGALGLRFLSSPGSVTTPNFHFTPTHPYKPISSS